MLGAQYSEARKSYPTNVKGVAWEQAGSQGPNISLWSFMAAGNQIIFKHVREAKKRFMQTNYRSQGANTGSCWWTRTHQQAQLVLHRHKILLYLLTFYYFLKNQKGIIVFRVTFFLQVSQWVNSSCDFDQLGAKFYRRAINHIYSENADKLSALEHCYSMCKCKSHREKSSISELTF